MRLDNVLYVPGATSNLLSIPAASLTGAEFKFARQTCTILKEGKAIGVATAGRHNLFCLNAVYQTPSL
jgi:hypothetical protein